MATLSGNLAETRLREKESVLQLLPYNSDGLYLNPAVEANWQGEQRRPREGLDPWQTYTLTAFFLGRIPAFAGMTARAFSGGRSLTGDAQKL
jgi:hypothetical protein